MNWIGLIVIVVILLKTIEKGGGWFDFLDTNARYNNWLSNFEFNAFFVFLCILVFAIVAWLLVEAIRPENQYSQHQPASISSQASHPLSKNSQIDRTKKNKLHGHY